MHRCATLVCATMVRSRVGRTEGLGIAGRRRRRDLRKPCGPDGAQAGDGDGVRAPEIGLAKRPANAPVGGPVAVAARGALCARS